MTKTIIRISFLFLIINIQCKKNDNKSVIDVSQITATDYQGNILSQDNTDWISDNNWTGKEDALMEMPTADQLINTETGVVTLYPAYPNPAANQQSLLIKTSKVTLVQVVITDKNLNIKKRFYYQSPNTPGSIIYLLDPSIFANDTNYRLYYGFYSLADGLFYKGHGDIKISR